MIEDLLIDQRFVFDLIRIMRPYLFEFQGVCQIHWPFLFFSVTQLILFVNNINNVNNVNIVVL